MKFYLINGVMLLIFFVQNIFTLPPFGDTGDEIIKKCKKSLSSKTITLQTDSSTLSDLNTPNDVTTTQKENFSSINYFPEESITTSQTDFLSTNSIPEESIITSQTDEFTPKPSDINTPNDVPAQKDNFSPINYNNPATVVLHNINSTDLEGNNKSNVCKTKSCHLTASKLLRLIDESKDVCNNFYEFTCGQRDSLKSNNDVFLDYNYKVFKKSLNKINKSVDEEKFKGFYGSCIKHNAFMAASNLSQIYEQVKNNVGGFILDEKRISDEKTHINNLIAKMMLLNHAPLFDVDFVLNADKKYIFKLIPPKLKIHPAIMDICKLRFENKLRDSSTLNDFYTKCIYNKSHSDIYANQMDKILKEIHALDDIVNVTSKNVLLEEIKLSFKNYYEFLQEFKFDFEYSKKNMGACSRIKTIQDWNTNFNEYSSVQFDWNQLFQSLVEKNISLQDYKLQVYSETRLFKHFFNKNITVKQMHNLLIATFLYDYYIELMPFEIQTTRDKYCLEKTIKLHPEVASEIYVKYLNSNHITNISKLQDKVTSIFNNIKNTFKKTVYENSISFTNHMQQDVSKILNDIQLEFYKPFKSDGVINYECEQYLDCFIKASNEFRIRKYMAWNETITETNYLWSHTAHVYDMNPVTVYLAYKIAIPYGMFYRYNNQLEELPYYIIIATIGQKLAYHLANYFSLTGLEVLREKFKETIDSLHEFSCSNEETYGINEYDNDIVNCIETNYESEQKLEINSKSVVFNVTAEHFFDQIISDGSAIRLAYDTAFLKPVDKKLPWIDSKYTDEQLFYFSAIQEFCDSNEDDLFTFSNKLYLDGISLPNQLRVLDFLRSDSNFASVFKCKRGENYDPEIKCTVFPYLKSHQENR